MLVVATGTATGIGGVRVLACGRAVFRTPVVGHDVLAGVNRDVRFTLVGVWLRP